MTMTVTVKTWSGGNNLFFVSMQIAQNPQAINLYNKISEYNYIFAIVCNGSDSNENNTTLI